MKRMNRTTLFVSCAILGLGTAAASADCADEIAALQSEIPSDAEARPSETREGIAKDGSLAPLEEGEDTSAQDEIATASTSGDTPATEMAIDEDVSTDSEEIAKDGTRAPLETDEEPGSQSESASGEDGSAVAVSQQSVEAQQDRASAGSGGNARTEALARAQAALDRGDEDACMSAVQEARSL